MSDWRVFGKGNVKREKLTMLDLSNYIRKKSRELETKPKINWSLNNERSVNPKGSKSSFVTQMESSTASCPQCKQTHFLNQCNIFRAMSFEQRHDFVQQNKLCFSCLQAGHFSKECYRKKPCSQANCFGKHTTLLHPPDNNPSQSHKPIELINFT